MGLATRARAASTGLSGSAGNTKETCPNVTLEIGVFFDGTGNNTANSEKGGSGLLRASYGNARSNVSLLHALYKNGSNYDIKNNCGKVGRKFASMYVEGIGTKAGMPIDAPIGLGTGMGMTGIEARVFDACTTLGSTINRLSPGVEPTEIILDVFGFSRGAAAARYFVNCIRQGYIHYKQFFINNRSAKVPEGRKFTIRFVGIFDTVAAYGIGSNNKNGPVNVHVATKQAKRIYHLTAKNEYRANFRLNHNIHGGGETTEMLGAHSDVGGGYRDSGDKTVVAPIQTYSFSNKEEAIAKRNAAVKYAKKYQVFEARKWLFEGWIDGTEQQGGFYNMPSEVKTRFVPNPFSATGSGKLVYSYTRGATLDRPWVKVGLSRISLRKMYFAATASKVPLTKIPESTEYIVPPKLAEISPSYAKGGPMPTGKTAQKILHDFGHVSCNYDSIGMSPDVNFKREIDWNEPDKAK